MKSVQNYANKRMKKGATLIELIVVMVILGILGIYVGTNVFAAKDEANKSSELETINNVKNLVAITKAQNSGNIYDITSAVGGVGEKIKNNITNLSPKLVYFVASTYAAQDTSTNLIAFATTEEGKTVIRESVAKLDKSFDGASATGTDGTFRYVNACTKTDGTDCYYQIQLSKSGNLASWETTIGASDLNGSSTNSAAAALQTWVKLGN